MRWFIIYKGTPVCTPGYAYHKGNMVNDDADASTSKECLNQCNRVENCKFWDFDTKKRTCRLRSDSGGAGRIVSQSHYGGHKFCDWGRLVNRILNQCIVFSKKFFPKYVESEVSLLF